MALIMWSISSEKDMFQGTWCVFRPEWRILWGFRETECKTLSYNQIVTHSKSTRLYIKEVSQCIILEGQG